MDGPGSHSITYSPLPDMLKPLFKKTNLQQGSVLIIFLLSLLLLTNLYIFFIPDGNTGRLEAQQKTTLALARAKKALIAYAVTYSLNQSQGNLGFLPCPETIHSTVEGISVLNCAIGGTRHVNQLGRLPWKTLQIPELTDGAGECLWYAMSGSFSPSPRALMLNDDTPGMFQVFNTDGSLYIGNTIESRAVAVIISPGQPLAHQQRMNASKAFRCKVPHDLIDANNYLESFQGIDNSIINQLTPDSLDRFISHSNIINNQKINDQIITISRADIFNAIKENANLYKNNISKLGKSLGQCLISFAQTNAANSANCESLPGCYLNCTNQHSLCDSNAEFKSDKISCDSQSAICLNHCRNLCLNRKARYLLNYQLPWPAPVNLKSDYRINNNYIDQQPVDTYLGRLPLLTPHSQQSISNLTRQKDNQNIFQSCALQSIRPAMFKLWENWKDHWFYIVGKDFSPEALTPANIPCTHCPKVNGKSYSAILLFSGPRLQTQLRRSSYTQSSSILLQNSKANLSNYLEGQNLLNINDTYGSGSYSRHNSNDKLFCIPETLTPPASVDEC